MEYFSVQMNRSEKCRLLIDRNENRLYRYHFKCMILVKLLTFQIFSLLPSSKSINNLSNQTKKKSLFSQILFNNKKSTETVINRKNFHVNNEHQNKVSDYKRKPKGKFTFKLWRTHRTIDSRHLNFWTYFNPFHTATKM